MNFNKLLSQIMVFALLFTLASCGKKNTDLSGNTVHDDFSPSGNICSECGYDNHSGILCEVSRSGNVSGAFCTFCGARDHLNDGCTLNEIHTASAILSPEVERCSVCNESFHSTIQHPYCNVCNAKSHIIHPKCPICKKNDHIESACPMCEYCRTEVHNTANHPTCSYCGKKHIESDTNCPKRKTEKCAYCNSATHKTTNHPTCSKCRKQHSESEIKCPYCQECLKHGSYNVHSAYSCPYNQSGSVVQNSFCPYCFEIHPSNVPCTGCTCFKSDGTHMNYCPQYGA